MYITMYTSISATDSGPVKACPTRNSVPERSPLYSAVPNLTHCSRKSLPGHQVTRPCKDNPHCDSLGWTRRMVILVSSYAAEMSDD